MEDRLNRVESAITRHDEQIASLFSKMNDVNAHLMIAYYTLSEFGFFAAFKAVKSIV